MLSYNIDCDFTMLSCKVSRIYECIVVVGCVSYPLSVFKVNSPSCVDSSKHKHTHLTSPTSKQPASILKLPITSQHSEHPVLTSSFRTPRDVQQNILSPEMPQQAKKKSVHFQSNSLQNSKRRNRRKNHSKPDSDVSTSESLPYGHPYTAASHHKNSGSHLPPAHLFQSNCSSDEEHVSDTDSSSTSGSYCFDSDAGAKVAQPKQQQRQTRVFLDFKPNIYDVKDVIV